MRGMRKPPRHSAPPLGQGVLAQSTEDAPARGVSSRGRPVVTAPDAGTARAPGLAWCLTPRQAPQAPNPGPSRTAVLRAEPDPAMRRRAGTTGGGVSRDGAGRESGRERS
jgi:hypothetical protein